MGTPTPPIHNGRNELTGSARFTGAGAGAPGGGTASHAADRAYDYDAIGNRKHRVEGDSGTPANWLYYCANSLNQYTTTDDASTCPPQQGQQTARSRMESRSRVQ
ncbi:MAG: hypothetical protein HZB38_13565 [Planctomycetes bacterium]|nr:hypothetical protein [Planctomycetota bacterium]